MRCFIFAKDFSSMKEFHPEIGFPSFAWLKENLASRAQIIFFRQMQEKYDNVVNIQHLSQNTLDKILDYIYTGVINVTEDNVYQLVESVDYTQIPGKRLCLFHNAVRLKLKANGSRDHALTIPWLVI